MGHGYDMGDMGHGYSTRAAAVGLTPKYQKICVNIGAVLSQTTDVIADSVFHTLGLGPSDVVIKF